MCRVVALLLLLIRFSWSQDESQDEPEYFYEEEIADDRSTSSDWTRKLELDVLRKAVDAPFEADERVDVQLLFSSFDHISLDDKQQLLRVHGRFCLVWNDQRLVWDPADYNGVGDLHVSSKDVWIPKFKILHSSIGRYSRDHWEVQHEQVHIFVNRLRVNVAYVVTCPRFHVRTGCPLDMSRFPNDKHVCSFMLSVKDFDNVNLYSYYSINENQAKMRHILSRNDTRPTVGDFTITNINGTTMFSDGLDLVEVARAGYTIPVAVQTIYLKRHAPTFFSTYTVPSLLFTVLNISAAISSTYMHSLTLYLANIFFIGLFIRDVTDHLPLHFDSIPDIVIHWAVCFGIALCGIIYTVTMDILQKRTSHDLPTKVDASDSPHPLNRIFSFTCGVVLFSLLSSVMFVV